MKKQALPVWALPAAGAAIGGTAGLLGGINIDDPRITPSIRAKKLLRCILLGGLAGTGVEGMRQGWKGISEGMQKDSSHKAGKRLLRNLLIKEAVEGGGATPPATNSWFSGNTWGVPNHYLVGGGIGALGGLTLYHLLNDKKKRKLSGYLGSALGGLGVGALGAGLYRMSQGMNLLGNNLPGGSEKAPPPTAEAMAHQTNISKAIENANPVDAHGNRRAPKTPEEAATVQQNAARSVGAEPNPVSGAVFWHSGGFANDFEKNFANMRADQEVELAKAKNPNLSKEEEQAIRDRYVNNVRINNPYAGYAEVAEDARQGVPQGFEANTSVATSKINKENSNSQKLTQLEKSRGVSPDRALNMIQDSIASGFKPLPVEEGYDPEGDRSMLTHASLANVNFDENAVRKILTQEGVTDPKMLNNLSGIARKMFDNEKARQAAATQRNEAANNLTANARNGIFEYILPTNVSGWNAWNPVYHARAFLNNHYWAPNTNKDRIASESLANATAAGQELTNDFRTAFLNTKATNSTEKPVTVDHNSDPNTFIGAVSHIHQIDKQRRQELAEANKRMKAEKIKIESAPPLLASVREEPWAKLETPKPLSFEIPKNETPENYLRGLKNYEKFLVNKYNTAAKASTFSQIFLGAGKGLNAMGELQKVQNQIQELEQAGYRATPTPTKYVINPEQKTYDAISSQPDLASKMQLYNKLTDDTLRKSAWNEIVTEYGIEEAKKHLPPSPSWGWGSGISLMPM